MSWQNPYTSPAPSTFLGGEYSTPPAPYSPTTTAPSAGNNYQDNEFATFTTTCTVTATEIFSQGGDSKADWSGNISGPRPYQDAVIALGVICGLLVICLAILLFFIFCLGWRCKKKGELDGEFAITPGYQALGSHKRRHDRTEYSRSGADDMADYITRLNRLDVPREYRSHRRSQPVTNQEYDGLNQAGCGNLGAQPQQPAYAQFPNPVAPVYFPLGHGNGQAAPVVQMPMNASAPPQHRGREEESAGEPSEVGSSSQEERLGSGHRHSSVRRHHSKTSNSARGRSGSN